MTSTAERLTDEAPTALERRLDEPVTADPASQPTSRALVERVEYARTLATSDLLPSQFRRKPGNVLWAIAYGEAIGIPDVVAMQSVHVIEGKPGASADLMVALARRAGHKVRTGTGVDDKGEPTAWAHLIRADDPDFVYVAEWTMDDARRAKIAGKDNWVKDPRSMLLARCKSGVVRQGCSEVLMGVIYTPDEVEEIAAAEGGTVTAPSRPGPGSIIAAAEAVRAPADELDATGQPYADAVVVEDQPDAEHLEPTEPGAQPNPAKDETAPEPGRTEPTPDVQPEPGAQDPDEGSEAQGAAESVADPDEPGTITAKQRNRLHAMYGEAGMTGRVARIAFAKQHAERVDGPAITSTNHLSVREASRVMDALQLRIDGGEA